MLRVLFLAVRDAEPAADDRHLARQPALQRAGTGSRDELAWERGRRLDGGKEGKCSEEDVELHGGRLEDG
jgi:hypothetical protein